jgi:hypothetical protein
MTSAGRDSVLVDYFPQCVNGYIIATAPGYEAKKYRVESLEEDLAVIVLEREYIKQFEILKAGRPAEYAIVTFTKENGQTRTVSWPEQKQVVLTQGQYEIKAYVYNNATIRLQGSSSEKCVDVPVGGVGGIFGATEEKCFTMTIPDQVVSMAVSGGGLQDYYIAETELQDSEKLVINTKDFGVPGKVEDLQINYNNIEISNLQIGFT